MNMLTEDKQVIDENSVIIEVETIELTKEAYNNCCKIIQLG